MKRIELQKFFMFVKRKFSSGWPKMQQAQNANWAQPMFLRRLVALVPAAKQQLSSRHLISLNPNGKIPSKFLTLKLRNPVIEV